MVFGKLKYLFRFYEAWNKDPSGRQTIELAWNIMLSGFQTY